MLHQLVYISDFNLDYPYSLEKLVQYAAKFNSKHNITGALWFDGGHFIQLLEGDKEEIKSLYNNRILPASAHTDLTIMSFEPCAERIFADWSMAYISNNSRAHEIAKEYSGDAQFNPRNYSGSDLIVLLCLLEEDKQKNIEDAI